MDQSRGRAILKILENVSRKYDGDMEKAAGELDKDLGSMWRDEVKKAGLGHELPGASKHCDKAKKMEAFYKRVKNKLDEVGESTQSIEGPLPLEEDSKPKSGKGMLHKMKVVLIGK